MNRGTTMKEHALFVFAFAFAAGVAAAGEMKVGARVEVGPNPPDMRDQGSVRVAFDGDKTYLVVWQQGRDFYQTESADIYAARVSADPSAGSGQAAKLLDEKPILVCAAADSQLSPSVAFCKAGEGGGVFLVTWSDMRSGRDFDIYGARVTPDGKVLDKDGFLIAGGPHNQYGPTVSRGNGKFLVAWQDYRDEKGYAIYLARVGVDAKMPDAGGVPVGGAEKVVRGGSAELASAGSSWFLFWRVPEARGTAALARIEEKDGALVVAETNGRLPSRTGGSGGAASDGKVVFYAGTTVGGRGGDFRPGTVVMFDAAKCAPLPNPNPKVGGGADGWNEDSMICSHIASPGVDGPIAIAHSGGVFLLAAKGSGAANVKPPYSNQILAARMGADGKMIEDPKAWQIIDDGVQPCTGPAVAGGKDGTFLIAYSVDGGAGKQRIFARTVSGR